MPIEYIQEPIKALVTDPARALDVIYTNNTMRPIMCLVTCWHVIANAARVCRVHGHVGGVYMASAGVLVPLGLGTIHSFMAFMVPPGTTYEVESNDLAPNVSVLNQWIEVEM